LQSIRLQIPQGRIVASRHPVAGNEAGPKEGRHVVAETIGCLPVKLVKTF
jgi:hypothetical protein